MSDNEKRLDADKGNKIAANLDRQSKESIKKAKRYQGYDLEDTSKKHSRRKKPWFWKVLGISLLLTVLVIVVCCLYLFRSEKKKADYISKINESNTMETLLSGHDNVQITCSYSHLAEGSDYKTTRLVKKNKSGDYYSYYKTEGTAADYKEVIKNKELYRYDEKFVQYYGLVSDDYEKNCVAQIEGAVFQASEDETIDTQKESGDVVKIQASYTVADGDRYTTEYGFAAGDIIQKVFTLDKESNVVMAEEESCNDEEFYSYTLEFDAEEKVPQFYKDLQQEEETRTCSVYYDYKGDKAKKYSFTFPIDTYFTLLGHEGFTVYADENCEKEFTEYQMEIQNPDGALTLYMKKTEE